MAVTILTETPLQDIITAIEGILTDIGYELEDLSGVTIDDWTEAPFVMVSYDGETFLDTNGQQKNESIAALTVMSKFRELTPTDSRQVGTLLIANLHKNITPEEINDAEKLVVEVSEQTSNTESYEADITTLTFSFNVRYRNEG
jgi:hypothetical protein